MGMTGEVRKVVTFSLKGEDVELLATAQQLPNFSGWVKSHLRKLTIQRVADAEVRAHISAQRGEDCES